MAFEVVLIGDGEMRKDVEGRIERLGLGGTVRVVGWCTGEQVREQILDSRALVLPSLAEGLPVVTMEALSLGRPVLSTSVAGIPELVEPGVCGWLSPAGSVDSLAAKIRLVLEAPPAELEEMGRAGTERVAARHRAATEAAKLARLFEATVSAEQHAGRLRSN
jgi:glycosyltransferase involved in cell wall biosynthesis